jgi:hypothetical protein
VELISASAPQAKYFDLLPTRVGVGKKISFHFPAFSPSCLRTLYEIPALAFCSIIEEKQFAEACATELPIFF